MHAHVQWHAHDWEVRDHINGGWNEVAHAPWCFKKVQIMMYISDFCTIKRSLEVLTLLRTTSLYPHIPPPLPSPDQIQAMCWLGQGHGIQGLLCTHVRVRFDHPGLNRISPPKAPATDALLITADKRIIVLPLFQHVVITIHVCSELIRKKVIIQKQ